MSNYNFKLDLSKFNGFGKITLQGKSGQAKRCAVIPLEDNNVFEGEKGTYLDLVCFETPDSEYGSHLVTISKTKEEQEQEKKTGERIRKPIVGNLKPFGTQAAEEEEYTRPAAPAPSGKGKAQPTSENFNEGADDLPF